MSKFSQLKFLGEILREAELITAAQVEVALHEQKYYELRIGEILALHGWLLQETADFFVEHWPDILQSSPRHRFGHYLKLASLLDEEQVLTILEEQKHLGIRFGAVAVLKGWLKTRTVDYFLENLFPHAKTTSDFQDKRQTHPNFQDKCQTWSSKSKITSSQTNPHSKDKRQTFPSKSKITSSQTNPSSDDFDLASVLGWKTECSSSILSLHDDEIKWID